MTTRSSSARSTRNTWLELNYVADPRWAISVQLPYLDRFHTTIAAGDTAISTSDATGLGDVRVLGRYQDSGRRAASAFRSASSCPPAASIRTFPPVRRPADSSIAGYNSAPARPTCWSAAPGSRVH